MLLNPHATPAATLSPMAADLPRPLAAVRDTTCRDWLLLAITYTKVMIALAWSRVLALLTRLPTTYLGAKSYFSFSSS